MPESESHVSLAVRSMSFVRFLAAVILSWMATHVFAHQPPVDESVAVSYPILSGVGVALRVDEGVCLISRVLPDTPAHKSGVLTEGDELVSVRNGDELVRVQGKPFGEIASAIRGPVGTEVTLEVRSGHQRHVETVTIRREPIAIRGATDYRDRIGHTVPDLKLNALGKRRTVGLAEFRGKIVVLDFWASWCGTCLPPIDRMQELVRSHPEWDKRVALVTVSVDAERDDAIRVIEKRKWNQTQNVAMDYDAAQKFGVRALPALVIIAADGKIATMGGSHALNLEKEIQQLLNGATD